MSSKKITKKKVIKKDESDKVEIKPEEIVAKPEELEEPEEKPEEIEELDDDEDDDNLGGDEAEVEDEDKKLDTNDNEEGDVEVNEDDEEGPEKDNCLYNVAKKNDDDDEEEDDEDIVFDDDDVVDAMIVVDKSHRITKPILYNYERVRLLGDRTQQITLGAKPLIKNTEKLSSKEIAELELKHNMIPIIIERPLPNGKKERWNVSELKH